MYICYSGTQLKIDCTIDKEEEETFNKIILRKLMNSS